MVPLQVIRSASVLSKSFGFFSTASLQRLFLRLFFNGFFFGRCSLMDCFFGLFFPRPRTSYSSPCTYRSTFPLPQDFLDVIFLSRPCRLFRTPEDFFFLWPTRSCFVFPVPEEDLWCLNKTRDAWRSLTKLSTLEDIVLDVDTKSPA